ncbi:acyltransferase family protein [Kocuria carniphila]|uniref:acyltransferase family protein n=1 Tax=Kocuria carniphila TaxID=262208 RepID=UPI0034CE5442
MALYSGYRPEVQGLRVVAVLLVVIYHVFVGRVSGGVDIFLLISAFFMTLSFVRKIEGGRRLDIPRYWLHIFRRLLPLASLIIVGTLVLLALFYPDTSIRDFRWQGLASVFYLQNWELASASVDYYAADHSTASPFQHFWSLSVQGQVFLLWPLIFGFAWWVRRRTRISSVPVLAVCFGLIFAASIAYSVVTTETQQAFAYFDTRARLWEFALGSLIALAIPYLNPPRIVRIILGWVGIVSMVSVGVLVDVQGAFPGWIALWPLLSAAAIIVAGNTGSPFGFDRFLSWWPVVKLGDAAYALYLVHWPLLITYLVIRDRPMAGWRSGIVLVVLSVVLAIIVTHKVENPIRRWQWPELSQRRSGAVIAVCVATVVVPTVLWMQTESVRAQRLVDNAYRNNPGAVALEPGFNFRGDPRTPALPLPEDLPANDAWIGESCPGDIALDPAYANACHEFVPNDSPDKTVLLVGNSHTQHWLPALEPMAETNNWRVIIYSQLGCFYTVAEEQPAESCKGWLNGADQAVDVIDPDLMFVQGTFTSVNGEQSKPGFEQRMRELDALGIPVVGIRDVPRFPGPLANCAIDKGTDHPDCYRGHAMLGTPDPQRALAAELPHFESMDMTDLVCPDQQCRPTVGNVYVYFDDDHLSEMYAHTLAPEFTRRAEQALSAAGVQL